ncbi:MAG: RNA polymerase sigma factor [Rudaea sp.]|uniref:RNA polymerase sigma factor n=1 Tax=Rudaea sp. TaxID=2136325 RepID=UPI0039E226B0
MHSRSKTGFVGSIAAQYGRRLQRFLAARLRNSADVPDLAQEVFLRLLRVEDHGQIRNPEAYLFTVASHVVHQHRAQESVDTASGDIAEILAGSALVAPDDPQASAAFDQRLEQLQALLKDLPPRVATTLVLARVHGESLKEIAQKLGVSRESVKKYLARAMEHCRQRAAETGSDVK